MLCLGEEVTLHFVPKGGYHDVPVLPAAVSGDRVANAASASHQIGGLTSKEVLDQAVFHQTGGLHPEQGIDQFASHQTGGLPPEERIEDQAASHQKRGLPPEEVVAQAASHQTGYLPPEERIDQAASHQKRGLPPEERIIQFAFHQTGYLPPKEQIDQVAVLSRQANGVPSEERAGQVGNNSVATAPIQDSSAVGRGSARSREIPDVVMEDHIQLGVQAHTSGVADQAGYTCTAVGEPPDIVMAEMNQDGGSLSMELGTFTSQDQVASWGSMASAEEVPNVVMENGEIRDHGSTSVGHDQTQGPDGPVSAPRIKDPIGSDVVVPTQGKGKGKGKGKDKDNVGKAKQSGPTLPAFSLTLVHGDSLILTGDDYEVRISFML